MPDVAARHRRADGRKRQAKLTELVARASYLMSESFGETLRRQGVSAAEWRVLRALAESDALKMSALAAIVLFKPPTLTKVIDRMERAGLVERRASLADRRCMMVGLTERGRQMATPLVLRLKQREAALDRALGKPFSRDIRSALAALLDRLKRLPRQPRALLDDRAPPG